MSAENSHQMHDFTFKVFSKSDENDFACRGILNGIGQGGCIMSDENSQQMHVFAFKTFFESDEKADFSSRLEGDSEQNRLKEIFDLFISKVGGWVRGWLANFC